MTYIVPSGNRFVTSDDNHDEAVLEVVRSDQGDGGWSLHAPGDDEILNSGEADWISSRDGNAYGCWNRPNKEDVNRALSILFVRKIAETPYDAALPTMWIREARKLCGMEDADPTMKEYNVGDKVRVKYIDGALEVTVSEKHLHPKAAGGYAYKLTDESGDWRWDDGQAIIGPATGKPAEHDAGG